MFIKKRKQKKLEQYIALVDSLSVSDFYFTTQKYSTLIKISNNPKADTDSMLFDVRNGKVLNLDGTAYRLLNIPTETLYSVPDCKLYRHYRRITDDAYPEGLHQIKVDEEKYQEFMMLIDGANEIEVSTHVLLADIMFDKTTKLLKFGIPETYLVERFNVYNLITDNHSYNESDYVAFVEQIKNYLKGTYREVFLWRLFI